MYQEANTLESSVKRMIENIQRQEGQDLEFMDDFPTKAHELAKEIAAFATSNRGTIYLGVNNSGIITGINGIDTINDRDNLDKISSRLAGICKGTIDPPITPELEYIEYNGRIVAEIIVPKGTEPVYFSQGKPYIRVLDTSTPAKATQVSELYRKYYLEQLTENMAENSIEGELKKIQYQLSDAETLLTNIEERPTKPQLSQLKYDLAATAEILHSFKYLQASRDYALYDEIGNIAYALDKMSNWQLYLDGGKSWQEFNLFGDNINKKIQDVFRRIEKNWINRVSPKEYIKSLYETIARLNDDINRFKNGSPQMKLETLQSRMNQTSLILGRMKNIFNASELGIEEDLVDLINLLRITSGSNFYYKIIKYLDDPNQADEFNKIEELIKVISEKIEI